MTYEQAIAAADKQGAGRAEGVPLLAQTIATLCLLHRGVNPRMAYDGARKLGFTARDVRKLQPAEFSDLMFQ
jgi:hypothetical protein